MPSAKKRSKSKDRQAKPNASSAASATNVVSDIAKEPFSFTTPTLTKPTTVDQNQDDAFVVTKSDAMTTITNVSRN